MQIMLNHILNVYYTAQVGSMFVAETERSECFRYTTEPESSVKSTFCDRFSDRPFLLVCEKSLCWPGLNSYRVVQNAAIYEPVVY